MKHVLTLTVFFMATSLLTSAGHAVQQPVSEVLMQAKCIPQRSAKSGEIEKYNCGEAKTDSLQMVGIKKANVKLINADEFDAFDKEVVDPNQAPAPEVEIVE